MARAMAKGVALELKVAARLSKADSSSLFKVTTIGGVETQFNIPKKFASAISARLKEIYGQEYWKGIQFHTRRRIEKYIREGIEEGQTQAQIARRISQDKSGIFGPSRAMTIARTETTGGLNGGKWEVRKELYADGTIVAEEWLAVLDKDTRTDHRNIDRVQVKGPNPIWDLGGWPARFPGDPLLPAHQRIRCRCTTVPIDPASLDEDAIEPEESAAATEPVVPEEEKQPASADPTDPKMPKGLSPADRVKWAMQNDPELNKLMADLEKVVKQAEQKIQKQEKIVEKARDARQEAWDKMTRIKDDPEARAAQAIVYDRAVRRHGDESEKLRKLKRASGLRPTIHKAIKVAGKDRLDMNENRRPDFQPSDVVKQRMKEASEFVSNSTNKNATEDFRKGRYTVFLEKNETGRAFHRGTDEMSVDPDRETTRVIVHEHGHGLENQLKLAGDYARAYRDSRVKGAKPVKLKDIFPSNGYGPEETGNPDQFDETLFGRTGRYYIGKTYASGDTEVVSMGMETLYERPAEFFRKDRDYFKFMLGLLRGKFNEQE